MKEVINDFSVWIVFGVLGLALVLFVWGKLRHDITAIICLLLLVTTGIISAEDAFLGFAHPAVITVAMILIVSQGLQYSGLIELIGSWVLKIGNRLFLQVAVLCLIVCFASAFMNNVGALAVLMPVAMHIAAKSGHSPSKILMPIAFASLLGGMITLIGTPPNIIIASFRKEELGEAFSMFDFAPVGALVAIIGLAYVILIGWRMLPERVKSGKNQERFNMEGYITEVVVQADSEIRGMALGEINRNLETEVLILHLIRDGHLIFMPDYNLVLRENDILSVEAEADDLDDFLKKSGTKLEGKEDLKNPVVGAENITQIEVVVMAGSALLERTAASIRMRNRYGVNLLALSRKDTQIRKRLDRINFQVGDVLLLQGDEGKISDTLSEMGCLPLADRGFRIGQPKKVALALSIFLGIVISIVLGWMQVQVAFTLAALLMVLGNILPKREIYTSIDWPVIVLLGAMLPMGTALENTGGAEMIANILLDLGEGWPIWVTLIALFIATMLLSNIINNAATAVIFAPLVLSLARSLSMSPDPFLMIVAVGASAAFLTPIGHQSNTLVMGPGAYKFSDYLRLGLPLSILLACIVVPLVLFFWPL